MKKLIKFVGAELSEKHQDEGCNHIYYHLPQDYIMQAFENSYMNEFYDIIVNASTSHSPAFYLGRWDIYALTRGKELVVDHLKNGGPDCECKNKYGWREIPHTFVDHRGFCHECGEYKRITIVPGMHIIVDEGRLCGIAKADGDIFFNAESPVLGKDT